jgi:hypothetical protein
MRTPTLFDELIITMSKSSIKRQINKSYLPSLRDGTRRTGWSVLEALLPGTVVDGQPLPNNWTFTYRTEGINSSNVTNDPEAHYHIRGLLYVRNDWYFTPRVWNNKGFFGTTPYTWLYEFVP